jgi:hypothetical protein
MLVWALRARSGPSWRVDLFVGDPPAQWRGRGPWGPAANGALFAELSPQDAERLGLADMPFNQPIRVELSARLLGN